MNIKLLATPTGIRFGLEGAKPSSPAPVLFNLIGAVEEMANAHYGAVGRKLIPHGVLTISVDLPCHGQDPIPGEPIGLPGWSFRIGQGTNIAAELAVRASAVLDYLVDEGYADSDRVTAVGTSRGGFQALHWAAVEPRIKAVAAFSPVTDLPILTEFADQKQLELVRHLALINGKTLSAIAGRPVWLTIGNNDERVGTDSCIKFARELARCAIERKLPAPVELHVTQSEGHRIHATAHEEAAAWLLPRL